MIRIPKMDWNWNSLLYSVQCLLVLRLLQPLQLLIPAVRFQHQAANDTCKLDKSVTVALFRQTTMYVHRNAGFHKERIFQPQTMRIIPRPWDIRASIELSFSVKSELPFTLGDNSKWTTLVTGGWEVEQTHR